ncbi:MAG: hypothetical protein Q8O60_02580, partial [Deltaproteobacteria bacterium]|nr:hypothetical protein [Deltaproteobacteria bacterium]
RPEEWTWGASLKYPTRMNIRLVGEHLLSGYGPIGFMNRLVRRRRMPGGVGRGREKLPLTRLESSLSYVKG